MKQQPKLILTIAGKNLQVTVSKAMWGVWRVLTYPLAITAGYYFFGTDGALFTTVLLVLTNRGQI
jgi:hypothetical protein